MSRKTNYQRELSWRVIHEEWNHESAFSGYLGAKKTEIRIIFCRSCDVYQRTIKKGIVKKVPLGSMPLMDTPFKRVAIDIVPHKWTGFSSFQFLYGHSVKGPGTILKDLWTKVVNSPEVKTSYEYVTELCECLEDSLKLAQVRTTEVSEKLQET